MYLEKWNVYKPPMNNRNSHTQKCPFICQLYIGACSPKLSLQFKFCIDEKGAFISLMIAGTNDLQSLCSIQKVATIFFAHQPSPHIYVCLIKRMCAETASHFWYIEIPTCVGKMFCCRLFFSLDFISCHSWNEQILTICNVLHWLEP